ncbi:hypothetical protein QBC35DRAFT_451876 [Podospora australis]|uniref:Uncharacterized protein n=1 Tax=Podospora australis TaxID=1536484 RepID=A0AAN6WT42_9PEZI|nr:hypothetical protein QBC35DRAFT_451876 [Podospora australis]
MAWARIFWAAFMKVEDLIVAQILRSPGFHRGVGRIHKSVEELRYGRSVHEPLKQGEATADPTRGQGGGFLKHFVDELKNQARGTPTDVAPPKK